jgi:hypothetical protein
MREKLSGEPSLLESKGFDALFNEVIIGTANLSIARSLLEASKNRPATMRASGSFFSLTIHALLESAQVYAAKLFEVDKRGECASIPWLLKKARARREKVKAQDRIDAELKVIEEAERKLIALGPLLRSLKNRRDRWLVHLDGKTVRDPAQFSKDSALTYPELEDVFAQATHILNSMAKLYKDDRVLINGRDYDDSSHTLDLIEKGIRANEQELERRVGPCPDVSGSI